MSLQLGVAARNALLDAIETAGGASPMLQLRTGSAPANCAAANTGTALATIACPSDWMAAASSGTKAIAGTWSVTATATGTVGHFRLFNNAETTCHIQGTCSGVGGGGDMILSTTAATSGGTVSVSSFTWTAPNA